MADRFQHYCGCGSSWELDTPTPIEIEHMFDLINRHHQHTTDEYTAAQSYTPTHTKDDGE